MPSTPHDEPMDRQDNPYAAPQSSTETPTPPPRRSVAWAALEIVVAIAIAVAIIWLVSAGPRP